MGSAYRVARDLVEAVTLTTRDIVMMGVGAFATLFLMSFGVPLALWLTGRSTPGNHATGNYGAVDVRARVDEDLPEDIERHETLMERSETIQRRHARAREAWLTHPSHARRAVPPPARADAPSGPETMLLSGNETTQLLCGLPLADAETDPIFTLPPAPRREVIVPDGLRNGAHSKAE